MIRTTVKFVCVALSLSLVSVLPAGQVDAQAPTDTLCSYSQAIAGCRREVFVVPALPDNAVFYYGEWLGWPAKCAHVGFDQTWCVLVVLEPAVPVVTAGDGVSCEARDGLWYCSADVTPAPRPVPAFTG